MPAHESWKMDSDRYIITGPFFKTIFPSASLVTTTAKALLARSYRSKRLSSLGM
jgi:hypothetical protein